METTHFEKIKTAIFILAQAIENRSIQGVCNDVTEALYPDSNVIEHHPLSSTKDDNYNQILDKRLTLLHILTLETKKEVDLYIEDWLQDNPLPQRNFSGTNPS